MNSKRHEKFKPQTTVLVAFCLSSQNLAHHLNLLAPELFFFILAHPVYKM